MKRIVILILILSCHWNTVLSQDSTELIYPKLMVFGSDTVMVYSIEQATEITKRNEHLKVLVQDSIRNSEKIETLELLNENCNDEVTQLNQIQQNQAEVIANNDSVSDLKDDRIEDLKKENKKLRRSKKWLIGTGASLGAVFTGLLIWSNIKK